MNERAERIIQEHVIWSMAAGLVPLPIVDILAVTAIQLDMLRQLAGLHEVRFSESEGKAWVTALAGNMVARIGANAIKLIPGLGSVIGGVSMSILSGASTYALGQVAIRHFERGGTFTNIDMSAARRAYEEELERGKRVASNLSNENKDAFTKLERLAKLKEKGVISAEDFEEQKKRILSSI
ncbi:Hypothetical protein A7982_12877 [Minicystis rosea]|nr:Hypothetical protein A7982_12877 [Minicystis rosea]